jgi:hypothetical protein
VPCRRLKPDGISKSLLSSLKIAVHLLKKSVQSALNVGPIVPRGAQNVPRGGQRDGLISVLKDAPSAALKDG